MLKYALGEITEEEYTKWIKGRSGEIFKLKEMIDGILAHHWFEYKKDFGHYHLQVFRHGERVMSVIHGNGTAGFECNRLEVLWEYGLDVEELTAEEAFKKLRKRL